MRSVELRCLGAAIGLASTVCLSAPANAIMVRHDIPDADYHIEDSVYPAVTDLLRRGDCMGTLIAPRWVVSAAHCAWDLLGETGHELTFDGVGYVVDEVHIHPAMSKRYDIALLELVDPVVGVQPMEIYRDTDEVGQVMVIMGRGDTGTGLDGMLGATWDGQLRRAYNTMIGATDYYLELNFDRPDSPEVLPLEGACGDGDSGAPGFIEGADGVSRVAGLCSWSDAIPYMNIGKYDSRDYYTRVSTYVEWIDDTLALAGSSTGNTATGPSTPTDTNETDSGGTGSGTGTGSSTGTGSTNTDARITDTGVDTGRSPKESGCGCSQGSPNTAGGWAVALFALLAARRRSASS